MKLIVIYALILTCIALKNASAESEDGDNVNEDLNLKFEIQNDQQHDSDEQFVAVHVDQLGIESLNPELPSIEAIITKFLPKHLHYIRTISATREIVNGFKYEIFFVMRNDADEEDIFCVIDVIEKPWLVNSAKYRRMTYNNCSLVNSPEDDISSLQFDINPTFSNQRTEMTEEELKQMEAQIITAATSSEEVESTTIVLEDATINPSSKNILDEFFSMQNLFAPPISSTTTTTTTFKPPLDLNMTSLDEIFDVKRIEPEKSQNLQVEEKEEVETLKNLEVEMKKAFSELFQSDPEFQMNIIALINRKDDDEAQKNYNQILAIIGRKLKDKIDSYSQERQNVDQETTENDQQVVINPNEPIVLNTSRKKRSLNLFPINSHKIDETKCVDDCELIRSKRQGFPGSSSFGDYFQSRSNFYKRNGNGISQRYSGGVGLPGGVREIAPNSDGRVQTYLLDAIVELNDRYDPDFATQGFQIFDVTVQVVAGTLHKFKANLYRNGAPITCSFEIWERVWIENGREVTVDCNGLSDKFYQDPKGIPGRPRPAVANTTPSPPTQPPSTIVPGSLKLPCYNIYSDCHPSKLAKQTPAPNALGFTQSTTPIPRPSPSPASYHSGANTLDNKQIPHQHTHLQHTNQANPSQPGKKHNQSPKNPQIPSISNPKVTMSQNSTYKHPPLKEITNKSFKNRSRRHIGTQEHDHGHDQSQAIDDSQQNLETAVANSNSQSIESSEIPHSRSKRSTEESDNNDHDNVHIGQTIVGGHNELPIDDKEVNDLLKAHLSRLDTGDETKPLELISIEKITTQVVSGVRYIVKGTFKIADSEEKKCKIDIWHRSWIKTEDGTQVKADCEDGLKLKMRSKRSIHQHHHHRPRPDHEEEHHQRSHSDRHHKHTSTLREFDDLKSEIIFENFIKKYERRYLNDDEKNLRLRIFKRNLHKIEMLNKHEQGTAKYGITEFADMTEKEYLRRTGLVAPQKHENDLGNPIAEIPDVELPVEFDWRDKGVVTNVKNQGNCGSCWSFSVTGNVESLHAIKTGQLEAYSEQELLDCDTTDNACNGGYMDDAFKAIEKIGGLELEQDYPYQAKKQNKCLFNQTLSHVKVKGVVDIPKGDEVAMQKFLVSTGPISIGINANAMQFYRGGVSHPWKILCRKSNLDHGVLIVGFGKKEYPQFNKTLPYWTIKNSWGPKWGEQGYYRVYRGDNTCGVAEMASSAVLE